MPDGWAWDETLYAGSAAYYERGRLPYPAALADVVTATLGLDGSGRLLDVGCGPGLVALRLADRVGNVVGIDADAEMVDHAARRAAELRVANTEWIAMRAEGLPASLGTFRAATFGQSFHWLDGARVAATILGMLEADGTLVEVNHWSLLGDPAPDSGYPAPPHDAIADLVARYLGPTRRAGQSVAPGRTSADAASILADAGYIGPARVTVPGGEVVMPSVADVVARCYSASGSAPHLFGPQRAAFEHELTDLLYRVSDSGRFAERVRDAELVIWRKP